MLIVGCATFPIPNELSGAGCCRTLVGETISPGWGHRRRRPGQHSTVYNHWNKNTDHFFHSDEVIVLQTRGLSEPGSESPFELGRVGQPAINKISEYASSYHTRVGSGHSKSSPKLPRKIKRKIDQMPDDVQHHVAKSECSKIYPVCDLRFKTCLFDLLDDLSTPKYYVLILVIQCESK